MFRSLVGAVLASFLSSLIVFGAPPNGRYPQPMKLTGSELYTHNPSTIYAEKLEYYYVFSTHVGVARSEALKGPWTVIGSSFPTGCSVITANAGHCGIYFLYYSASQFGAQNSGIGAATNKAMEYDKPFFRYGGALWFKTRFDAAALPASGDEYKVFVGRSTSASESFVDAAG
ncbi:hypothetical protein BDV93DRAFT_553992 [Ceratobasidium sp. AG-I]|nr:hypothetical protein BDV93DRAFT_553992 [Ceratobasidium sp. AG-I]